MAAAKVVYAQLAYNKDFQDTLENALSATPYVDHPVVIEDSSQYHKFTDEQREQLLSTGAIIKQFPWERDHPKMYQYGVDDAHELGADWASVLRCHEHPNEAFLKNIRSFCVQLDKQGIDMAGLKCHAQFAIADAVWLSSLSVDTRPDGWMDLDKYP